MDIKTLKNPPVKEALLEIRFNPNKNVTINKLEEFADSLSDEYTTKESVENQNFAFMFSKGKGPKHDFNIEPSGFKLTNLQNNRVVIAAIDKFIVSFLAPYTPWPDLKDTAESLYKKYLEFVPQTEIIRLGVRYINNIKLPLTKDFNFQQYINTFQPLPKHEALPDSLSKFESIVVMPHDDIGCTSTTRQAILDAEGVDEGGSAYLPFVLDIDVYQNKVIDPVQTKEVWESFEKMRTKKNAIFFGTLTDTAITPYD
jgi:uncharacterized protein (TIGR04255 family)